MNLDILIKALQLVCALGLLVFLHEGGHFLFAKLFCCRVERFFLFFDVKFHLLSTYDSWLRRLVGKKPVPRKPDGSHEYAGTEYGIGWLPLGGYVAISGMIDENLSTNDLSATPQPWEFRTKPAWQRLLIMLGGILMNFITAFVIYAMILFAWGKQYIATEDLTHGMKFSAAAKADGFVDGDRILGVDSKTFVSWSAGNLRDIANGHTAHVLRGGDSLDISLPAGLSLLDMLEEPLYATPLLPLAIDSVMPGSPAEAVGLRKGDVITAINGQAVNDFQDLYYALLALAERVDELSTHADSLRLRTVALTLRGDSTERTAVLNPDFTLGFANAAPDYRITTRTYSFFESFPAGVAYGWKTLTGYVSDLKYLFTKKGARSVGGFIAIGNIFPSTWDWYAFWTLTAWLSAALGVMNLLPIPALDGGHVLFALYEIITRRKPSDKFLLRAQYVGMFLLIALLIYANLNDILRLFGI